MPTQWAATTGDRIRSLLRRGRFVTVTIAVLVVAGATLLGLAWTQVSGPPDTWAGEPDAGSEPGTVAGSGRTPAANRPRIQSPSPAPEPDHRSNPSARVRVESAGSQPVRIEIPRIGVRTSIMPLGMAADRTVEVPPFDRADEVGWYEQSPVPGAVGPAVLVGHIDAPGGPAVFYRLAALEPGDRIRILRADGRSVTFAVNRVETVPKDQFPTDKVYGDLNHPGLRLITCGGNYDRSSGGYQGNTIAYAALVRGDARKQ